MGRDLQRAVTPPRPIGLVEATLGGSSIESWSSADALAVCEPRRDSSSGGNGGLWNGLIEPLLSSTLKGVVWYQVGSSSPATPTFLPMVRKTHQPPCYVRATSRS